ncbi:ROK-family protein [Micromonospora sp. ATCC 39149]|nr:ROK-family protein [Micromonospora sp. ATCC 39149]
MLVWVGAGVGLAIMIGGRLHHGSSGAAGEIGYLPVPGVPIPRDVSRRAKPAFQQLAGADAVLAVAREHGLAADSAADAVRAAIAAGTTGGPLLDELARRLALGVASTCVVLDPPLVVLAGEVGQAGGAALAERVQHEVAAITLVRPRVVPTGLTEEPILRGALRTALDAVRDEVFGSTVG